MMTGEHFDPWKCVSYRPKMLKDCSRLSRAMLRKPLLHCKLLLGQLGQTTFKANLPGQSCAMEIVFQWCNGATMVSHESSLNSHSDQHLSCLRSSEMFWVSIDTMPNDALLASQLENSWKVRVTASRSSIFLDLPVFHLGKRMQHASLGYCWIIPAHSLLCADRHNKNSTLDIINKQKLQNASDCFIKNGVSLFWI